jgi:SAM-dependent methyltransferase
MPFGDEAFNFVTCHAAFKNFADPLGALDEIHRVLKRGGRASIHDLRQDASREDVDAEVERMGLSWPNRVLTKLVFRTTLLKNAYTRDALGRLVARSRFGTGEIVDEGIGLELRLTKEAPSPRSGRPASGELAGHEDAARCRLPKPPSARTRG